jgi:hypothetical protein
MCFPQGPLLESRMQVNLIEGGYYTRFADNALF